MLINDIIKEKNLTTYQLHKKASIPMSTLSDICSGKTSLKKCNVETIYKISKALGVSMEYLVESSYLEAPVKRSSFEIFKSNICHLIKDKGDTNFIIETLETNQIRILYDRKWYPEAFYLLAMVDYLSRINNIPMCGNYNDIRNQKLKREIYPASLLISCATLNDESLKENFRDIAIPEFKRFNIMESEIRDVY